MLKVLMAHLLRASRQRVAYSSPQEHQTDSGRHSYSSVAACTRVSPNNEDRFDGALRLERGRPRPSLLRACRSAFGREFLGLGWLKAANAGLGFSGPLLLKVVVDAVQEAARGDEEGLALTQRFFIIFCFSCCRALAPVV